MNDIEGYCRTFQFDPLAWVLFSFPWGEAGALESTSGPERWQAEVLKHIGGSLRANRSLEASLARVAISSGHSVGKSALVAWLVLWWLSTRPNARMTVTANTGLQLSTRTWPELAKWHDLASDTIRDATGLTFERSATALRCRLAPDQWFAAAVTWSERRPEAIAGEHGQHVATIMDEASAIPRVIWDTVAGGLTSGECLLVVCGNPTRPSGPFHDVFHRDRAMWETWRVDARSVTRAGVNRALFDDWVDRYGEDSDFVRIRVRGEFPRQGASQFIPQPLIDEARGRQLPPEAYGFAPRVLGVDVATFGDDQSVILRRQGLQLPAHCTSSFRGLDPLQVGDHVANAKREWGAQAVFVDGIGVGAGTVARLRELGVPCTNIGAAGGLAAARQAAAKMGAAIETSDMPTLLWAHVREWLRDGGSLLYAPRELIDDLEGREYIEDPRSGQIRLEPKAALKVRGRPSPDFADALAATFAVAVHKRPMTGGIVRPIAGPRLRSYGIGVA